VPSATEFGPLMSNETLALGVIVFSFIMFGAFLWVSVTYLPGLPEPVAAPSAPAPAGPDLWATPSSVDMDRSAAPVDPPEDTRPRLQIPCEQDGAKVFVSPKDVSFVRADGHYTQVYTETAGRLFSAWPVTEAAKRLMPEGFLQTHRSYLVNPSHVARFERTKDKGLCHFDSAALPPAPVSRSKLRSTQDALATAEGAVRAS
jgi:hypothetical protein